MNAVSGGNLKLRLEASASGLDRFVVCAEGVRAVVSWEEHEDALPKRAVLVGAWHHPLAAPISHTVVGSGALCKVLIALCAVHCFCGNW